MNAHSLTFHGFGTRIVSVENIASSPAASASNISGPIFLHSKDQSTWGHYMNIFLKGGWGGGCWQNQEQLV